MVIGEMVRGLTVTIEVIRMGLNMITIAGIGMTIGITKVIMIMVEVLIGIRLLGNGKMIIGMA